MFQLEPNQDKLSEFDFLYVVKISLVHFRYFYNFKRPNGIQSVCKILPISLQNVLGTPGVTTVM